MNVRLTKPPGLVGDPLTATCRGLLGTASEAHARSTQLPEKYSGQSGMPVTVASDASFQPWPMMSIRLRPGLVISGSQPKKPP